MPSSLPPLLTHALSISAARRFSKDQGHVDDQLPLCFFDALQSGFQVLGAFVLVAVAVPAILPVFVPLAVLFVVLRKRYVTTARSVAACAHPLALQRHLFRPTVLLRPAVLYLLGPRLGAGLQSPGCSVPARGRFYTYSQAICHAPC